MDPQTELQQRQRVVQEAKTWLWTPQRHLGRVKGPRGGCDCATLIAEVYGSCNVFNAEVRNYNYQWFLHRNDEWYLEEIEKYCDQVSGPPDRWPKPGDLVIYLVGRVYGHGAIILDWPQVIHLNPVSGMVTMDNGNSSPFVISRKRRFYIVKGWS